MPPAVESSAYPGPREGEVLELTVEDLGYGGAGVARHQGLLCVVPRCLPGERVRARIWRRSRHTARLSLEELVEPSPQRVPARCPHFGSCGGCQLQHLAYRDQVAAKVASLRQRLQRALGEGAPGRLQEPVLAAATMGYRVRNRFLVRGGRLAFGGLAGRISTVDSCPLAAPGTEEVLAPLRDWLAGRDCPWLQAVTVHVGAPPAVLLEVDGAPEREVLAELLGRWAGLSVSLRDQHRRRRHLQGPGRIAMPCGPFELLLSPGAFTQANPEVTGRLYSRILAELDPDRGCEVLDLYCGTGGLALHLAQRACHVYAVDVDPDALADARASQHHNLLPNLTFRAGKAERIARRLLLAGARFPLATVNPPRTGLAPELTDLLPRLGVRRLAYLSCSPATLVRDLTALTEQGYGPRRIVPFDMFPQTYHLEVLAVLQWGG